MLATISLTFTHTLSLGWLDGFSLASLVTGDCLHVFTGIHCSIVCFRVELASLAFYSKIIHCVLWVSVAENPHETILVLPGPPGVSKELSYHSRSFLVALS